MQKQLYQERPLGFPGPTGRGVTSSSWWQHYASLGVTPPSHTRVGHTVIPSISFCWILYRRSTSLTQSAPTHSPSHQPTDPANNQPSIPLLSSSGYAFNLWCGAGCRHPLDTQCLL